MIDEEFPVTEVKTIEVRYKKDGVKKTRKLWMAKGESAEGEIKANFTFESNPGVSEDDFIEFKIVKKQTKIKEVKD